MTELADRLLLLAALSLAGSLLFSVQTTAKPAGRPADNPWARLAPPARPQPPARREAIPQRKWALAFDFVDRFAEGRAADSPATNPATESVGGVSRGGIFQHPPLKVDGTYATLTFPAIPIPELKPGERAMLRLYTGISDRVERSKLPSFDGCEFVVAVDGKVVLRREQDRQVWQPWELDLSDHAGRSVAVEFRMGPRSNSAADWAVWGDPRIEIEGRPFAPPEGPHAPFLRMEALDRQPAPDRVALRDATPAGAALISVLDENLDLPTALQREAASAGPPRVPLAPEMAVGEGEDPGNHTLVRILGRWGIADVQFLAYPPQVKGGVDVAVGRTRSGDVRLVTAPLADTAVTHLRVFDRWGVPAAGIDASTAGQPPYRVAVGAFRTRREGDLVAVVPYRSARPRSVLLFTLDGRPAGRFAIPGDAGGDVSLAARRRPSGATLVAWMPKSREAVEFGARGQAARWLVLAPDVTAVYPGAFDGLGIVASTEHGQVSEVLRIGSAKSGGSTIRVGVGASENVFWFQWYRPVPQGRYVRSSVYRHIRTDAMPPALRNPAASPSDPEQWGGKTVEQAMARAGDLTHYEQTLPAAWEPCFTHRWMKGAFQAWRDAVDPETGLPAYVSLSRNNHPAEYGEFGNIGFYVGTYAFGLPPVDRLYVLPLRAALRRLVTDYRSDAEHFVALEPNHEHEIAVEADGSMGDYNPHMVSGFYDYLRRTRGLDSLGISRTFGVPASGWFDAPRRWERGPWDAYEAANPYFQEWIAYQRYVVNRRLAQTFREALLAGFPPEMVKCHQIPDAYAIGGLSAFSTAVNRYTPVDYALNAGTGYGFTRYGVWYRAPHDALQDAHQAGFGSVVMGEYQALTPSVEDAYGQLKWMVDHGCLSAHCMLWPASEDRGFNDSMDAALRRLIAEDKPRPGITGGVGQVCPVVEGSKRYEVMQIGAGAERTGLLKSVTVDGRREGTVYVTPFHAHVEVVPVPTPDRLQVAGRRVLLPDTGWLDSGVQVEVELMARSAKPGGRLRFEAVREGAPLPGTAVDTALTAAWKPVRFTLRAQLPDDGVRIAVTGSGSVETRGLRIVREVECTARLWRGILGGRRHAGGVRFDVIPPSGP